MTRRGGMGLKVVGSVAAGLILIYGLYSYHDVQTRLKRSEEKGERLRQQHDSLSAQLQGKYLKNIWGTRTFVYYNQI